MKITVNGNSHNTLANNLEDLLIELQYKGKIATALNESFVPLNERKNTVLKYDDRVEIVAPMEGG